MKRIFTISAALVFAVNVFLPVRQASAQAPQKMSYQAVIRNSSDQLVADHAVRMKISILQGSATGTAVYVETQSKSTNANGLVTIELGGGTIVSGTFTGIDWPAGPYFIKTETDPTGGTNYTITGTSQLLSVPYALHSKSSADGFATVYSEADKRPVLIENGNIGIGTSPQNWAKLDVNGRMNVGPGQDTWGSQVNINALSLEKGKAYALTSTGGNAGEGQGKLLFACYGKGNAMVMDSSLNIGIGTNNPTSKLDVMGEINVNNNKIINVANPVNATDAVNKAYVDGSNEHYIGESYGGGIVFYLTPDLKHGLIASTVEQGESSWYNAQDEISNSYGHSTDGKNYTDWRLPTKYELNLLYLQRTVVGGVIGLGDYWSSTESSSSNAWFQYFSNGTKEASNKDLYHNARAIRSF